MTSKINHSKRCCDDAEKRTRASLSADNADCQCKPHTAHSDAPKRSLKIDFMYLDLKVCTRCRGSYASLQEAISEVRNVLAATGVEVIVHKVLVKSEAQAEALGFIVSPTIRVNGRDIQFNFRESRCESCSTLCDCEQGVSCREWEYQGQWYPLPPKGLIMEAILKAVYAGAGQARKAETTVQPLPDNLKRFFSSVKS